ncbi:sulfonate transport system substrate-binding protein [Pseudomonas chlororaphis]|uniref:ABC transporter substrate-binding protein n=1 Tax=Pseudomonas chlororaphis TaxID=587753 RepID=UPI000879B855|nr:ABC transporter substrate-binding protein [Pseudomonas chlororaphis]AZD67044.1 ABC transporter, substrate-binding protein [Pseudomonas chlororaphis subsp. aurantiaca]QIT23056.1 ABC transporter substrate-binding protein [Pseudomonas chlororaphis subsp. aurantiaca]WDH01142.1 ABC transporter substrate-binding protein [Pseudomonas chlororaphis]WDH10012.1 ABC transporter substrate-binding protein [Pseudomonas chlororaphis]SDT16283.1 sulfonate transport system substrate-binding protein [Pseudomon
MSEYLNRRGFLAASSLAVGALGLSSLGLSSLGFAPRAFAQNNSLADLTLGVATYRGQDSYFVEDAGTADTPYKVEYSEFAGGNLIVEALASGSLDVGGMSEIPPIFSIQSHRQPRLIAVLQGDVNNQVFLIPKDSKVESVAQLRGKRVGYVRSTTSHYFLIKALKEQGLTLNDITAVALTPQDGFSAFQSGQLDAWVIYGVFIQLAKFRSGARVLKTALGYLSGNYLIAARPAALEEPLRKQAIQDYIQRQARTLEWINNNPEPWASKSAQLLGVDKAVFLDMYNNRSQPSQIIAVNDQAIASQQAVADLFFDAGVLSERLDVSPLWDRSFALLPL